MTSDNSDTNAELDRTVDALVDELETTHTALGALVTHRVVAGIEEIDVDPEDVSAAYRAELEEIAEQLGEISSSEIEAARDDSVASGRIDDSIRGYY